MTPAEARFKEAVNALIDEGIYPSGSQIYRRLGRDSTRGNMNGREMVWRDKVMLSRGFHYDDRMWMYRWRHPEWRAGPRR